MPLSIAQPLAGDAVVHPACPGALLVPVSSPETRGSLLLPRLLPFPSTAPFSEQFALAESFPLPQVTVLPQQRGPAWFIAFCSGQLILKQRDSLNMAGWKAGLKCAGREIVLNKATKSEKIVEKKCMLAGRTASCRSWQEKRAQACPVFGGYRRGRKKKKTF